MKPGLRKKLEQKYQIEIDKAAQLLLENGDEADATSAVKKVEHYSQLLEATKASRRKERFWALGVAALCLMIAGLLWSLRISTTPFLLNIQTSAVRMKVTKEWRHQESFSEAKSLPDSEVEVDGADEVNLDGLPCGRSALVRGGKAQLTDLRLAADSEIELTAKHDHLQLSAQKGRVQGEITFVGPVEIANDDDVCSKKKLGKTTSDIPQSISFNSEARVGEPLFLETRPPVPWSLRNLEVADLEFSEETIPGSGEFETSIRKGNVTLFDTFTTVTLQEGDQLRLEGLKGKCSRVWADDGLNLICELSARKILLGPADGERNLSPSWLEYLYHKQSLAFLWGVLTFLCGTLWGIRNIIWRAE